MIKVSNTAGIFNPEDAVFDNIINISADSGPSAGIRVRSLGSGLVPVYEEHYTRRSCNYSLNEWENLNWETKAFEVAMSRIDNAVQIHQAEAEAAAIKTK